MVEYRPLPDGTRETVHEYTSYAFSPEEGPPEYDPNEDDDRVNLGSRRGVYEDGAPEDADPLCVCRHHWFDARVRGEFHPTPGLAAVATPPENRRGGYVRRLIEASLEEYRERGARFSVLWPFRYRFYREYGWDTCNRSLIYESEPEALAFAADAVFDGAYERIEADDYERIEPVYEAHGSEYALTLDRDEDWWRHRVFRGGSTDPFVYAWERDGEPRGYVIYSVEGEWGDRTLRVWKLAHVDHEAYLALLAFVYNHDSQVNEVRIREPEPERLLDLVPDPEDVDCSFEDGPMVRIVDVAETLSRLSYPDEDARITLAVDDPLVDWNDGTFALEAAGGEAACEPTATDSGTDGTEDRPDARLDVGALSQLVVGSRSAAELERVGRIEARSDDAIAALGRLFPREPVYLRDGF